MRSRGGAVSRRASLPGASELFRSTDPSAGTTNGRQPARPADRTGSGRQKHDAKITVYISDEELLALEHARLACRAQHGLVVDRGRVVREAVAVLLADFEENGEESLLVQRLRLERGR
jgi:L-aminopeptidase/D-esterase-like protein